ncbi:class D sortase [Desnuesiella massiliensis]|uniref:class D sortase n=1 Tax=Desnuesiella massiliensis TaxID=1650662 RepID=UPI0006E21261|nr:class D sortase [Desnuesiella massiliensis]
MKKNAIGIVLIIVGLAIIGAAVFMRYSADKKQNEIKAKFEKTLKELGENEKAPSSENNDSKASNSPGDRPNKQDIDAIALMIIPKIDLNVAVSEGTDMETLKYAVGHFEGTALPGEKGNFSVAGHRNYTYSQYFNRADELVNGDEILIKTKKGEFKYSVSGKKIVNPEEISVLDPTEDATLTIVTCTPGATQRLIINAKLIK